MIKKGILVGLFGLLLAGNAIAEETKLSAGKGVTIADMALDQNQALIVNPFGNYFDYRVEGVCVWVVWTWFGPVYSTTLYVRHFLPDLLVSVYPEYGNNAFYEANELIDKPMKLAGEATHKALWHMESGMGDTGDTARNTMNRFYEVDVIGNPAISEFSASYETIPSVSMPYNPYYTSLLDKVMWHSPELEIITHPQSLIPGIDNEGSALAPWGSLYPRYGVVSQFSQYKAAAMIALRAGHMATHAGGTHLVTPIATGTNACGQHCNVSGVELNDNSKSKFQRVYPKPANTKFDSNDFGRNDLMDGNIMSPYGQQWTEAGNNRYAWLVWRKYEGCIQGRGKFVAAYH